MFCITALCSAVFFSSIGFNADIANNASAKDTSLEVKVNPVLSIRIAKDYNDGNGYIDITDLDLNISPIAGGRFTKDDLSVLVSTSNDTGYTLTFANNDADNSMHHTDATITTTIPSITAPTGSNTITEANFPVNSWAYSLEPKTISGSDNTAQSFSPIPLSTSAATIKTTTAPTTEDATAVTFAAKVDTSVPAGTYLDTVVFSATTNYVPQNPLQTITYMQEMTPAICNATPTPLPTDTDVPEATLIDTRDNKTYVVRKLADGNCWMVQNLDLDLSTATALTSANTNLITKSTWTPQNNTQTTVGTAWARDGGDVARSMDPGNIYFPNGVGTGTADANGNLAGSTTGEPWEHIGNYYNWYAATAGTGTAAMTEGQVATDSICPRGWKLPDNSGSKSFLNLVTTTYGLQDNNAADSTKILQAPLNFVRDGHYHWSNGQVYHKGTDGQWWSTAAASATSAHYLYTNSSRVIPQHADNKGFGFTVRCVADNTITGISTMQEMTSDVCAATPTPAASAATVPQATLTDTRDGNTYVVRKLADSNCWMSQDLKLGKMGEDIVLAPDDSDVDTSTTIPASQIQNTDGILWDDAGVYHVYDRSDNASNGNYYNWYTATAGTGMATMVNSDAPYSVCPKGWGLPSVAGAKSLKNLFDTYNVTVGADILAEPLSFVITMNYAYQYSAIHNPGWGYYWTSSAANTAIKAYGLRFSNSSIDSQHDNLEKMHGFTIRCVAR